MIISFSTEVQDSVSFYTCFSGKAGFHLGGLNTRFNYFGGVATKENSDLGSKRLFALIWLYSVIIPAWNFLQLQKKDKCVALKLS